MTFSGDDLPKIWEFKGHAAKDTYFELRVFGRPSAKALANVIKQMELYREFVAEDEAAEVVSEPPPVDGEAGTTDTVDLAREDLPSPKASTSNEG
jgi:hypothetical protein